MAAGITRRIVMTSELIRGRERERKEIPVTDFVVYIAAQQRMKDVFAEEANRPIPSRRNHRLNLDAMRQRISAALYRLAEAMRPCDDPAEMPLPAAR